uniref:Uncharacterized protein n=1 Tax=Meloidogyne enterolobii TaxID=390850 RepID=A0A6V7W999_MELEN|nr:unnamed protein product [Meloidogyne enterolobii]
MEERKKSDHTLRFIGKNLVNGLFEKTIGDLIKLNDLNPGLKFVKIKNKWIEFDSDCCDNMCINSFKPIGNCIKGSGYGNIIDEENIKYINCLDGKGGCDKEIIVCTENPFNPPQSCINYPLYYFEVKCKVERELSSNGVNSMIIIGFKDCIENKYISYLCKRS